MTHGGLSSVTQESWGGFFGSPPLCGVTQSPNPLSSTFVLTNLHINHYVLSLRTKLVSGGDGITVELFQILKDDAVKAPPCPSRRTPCLLPHCCITPPRSLSLHVLLLIPEFAFQIFFCLILSYAFVINSGITFSRKPSLICSSSN